MNFRSLSTKLLLLLTAVAAFAFRQDADDFEFYLSSNRIYTPGESGISVELGGRIDQRSTIQLHAFRIEDPVGFFLKQRDPHSPGSGSSERDTANIVNLNDRREFKQVTSWEQKITVKNKYWQQESIPVPLKEKGVYLIQATTRGKTATTVLVITDLGMIVKQANGEALAFVVNRLTGEKIASMPVTFARGAKSRVDTRTGADGVAMASLPSVVEEADEFREDWGWGGNGNQLLVLGARDGGFVISDSYYYSHYSRNGDATTIYLHTDRPVYRPSQTVYYRGIARRVNTDGIYENAAGDTAYIEVTDSRGGSVKKDTLRLSDFGTFNGELSLADEPPLGNYTVMVTIKGSSNSFSFSVEEYKKPEYEVIVSTDKQSYTRGDEIRATVKADYYFGSPVAEAQVEYQVFRLRYFRPWWWRSEWAYLYEGDEMRGGYGGGMEMIHSGTGKLNDDGTFQFSYRTDAKADQDYIYRIQANVVDASRRSISGMATAKVTRGELYVTSHTSKYVYKPGDEVTVNVETYSFDGDKGISAPFEVRVERVWWEQRRRDRDGRESEVIWKGSGTTNENGTGTATFAATKAGYYNVTVTARDKRGNDIATSTSLYIADKSYTDWYRGGGDVQIIPDRELYKPGETMSALVIMPASNIDMLVSAEATTIYSYQVERLGSNSAIIRMPIEARHAPMFYLNVSALVNENFYNSGTRVTVAPEGKLIRLVVKTDKETYKPGESGKVTVRALDAKGEPVPDVDLALGVVDEAVYAIRPDNTPDIQKFFYGSRWNQVSTNSSLSFSFYSRSRRTMARDAVGTAAAADGFAQEESMSLQKAAAPPPPPSAPPVANMNYVEPTIRTDFRDLMFWTPSVRTDSRGYATVDVSFPDNLTTWRITARGVTRATAVGQATAEVIARKDLLVRMETPRFITQGDELVIATTVHNYLSSAKGTKVQFSVEGVTASEREKTITIPANGEERIDWRIKAPAIGTAKLTVKALTDEESDAMELKVPILPQGVRTGMGAIADITEPNATRTLTLTMPSNSDPATGELKLSLAPSAASSIIGALDELIGYPYGCVEQTMSRFLPTVVVADALKKLDVPFDRTKREELPKMVNKGLTRLYGLQHDDGGWGWWENDKTNGFMTAYVMYGMAVAKGAGYDVQEVRYSNGVNSLRSMIESRKGGGSMGENDAKLDPTTEAYMLYVASFISQGTRDRLYIDRIAALSRRNDINNYALALLTLASRYQGDNVTAEKLASRLVSNAEVTATSAHWSGKSWHYNWQDDAVETSAFAVKALLESKGETDLVKKGIHYLLSQKHGDSWHNTRQTAMVIYALVDYIQSSRELEPDYTITVRVNGREVYTKRMTRADIFAPEQQVKVDHTILRQGENTVTIEKSGAGKLYAAARLNYYATGPAIRSADAGFKVERSYFTLRRDRKDGRFIYTKQPFTGTVKSGDEIFVKVKIVPDSRYEYFMLEDPLPAGCEVVTSTEGYEIPGESGYSRGKEAYPYYYWNWWYADRDVRDEKVAFFAREMQPQTYEFSYIMRAQIPGSYAVMPSVGALMYYPEVRGNSDALAVKITE